jgi:hypothetical protein
LNRKVSDQAGQIARLEATVNQLTGHIADFAGHEDLIRDLDSRVTQLDVVAGQERLTAALEPLRCEISVLQMWGPQFDSRVISHFPVIFDEFHLKRFNLLWRGSRDGFTAQEFHRCCDGRANTLTLIADADGNTFGGFTPVEWESRHDFPYNKGDDSARSFLFTLQNPDGFPERKCPLRDERRQWAICCNSEYGPVFGHDIDICDMIVSDNCSACADSSTAWAHNLILGGIGKRDPYGGRAYTNDTEVEYFFTGSAFFEVKEIEVFEIAD